MCFWERHLAQDGSVWRTGLQHGASQKKGEVEEEGQELERRGLETGTNAQAQRKISILNSHGGQ